MTISEYMLPFATVRKEGVLPTTLKNIEDAATFMLAWAAAVRKGDSTDGALVDAVSDIPDHVEPIFHAALSVAMDIALGDSECGLCDGDTGGH